MSLKMSKSHARLSIGRAGFGVAATLKWAPGDMMMMALFGAAQAAKKFLRPIRASAVKAISLFRL
jgi:hypothetical protein